MSSVPLWFNFFSIPTPEFRISAHWDAIENGSHYRRDVSLGEDAPLNKGPVKDCLDLLVVPVYAPNMVQFNLHSAKAQFSKVARMVKAGQTVILCERNKPFAEIRPLPGIAKPRKRKLGQMKGLCPMSADFFQADAEIADSLNENPVFPPKRGPIPPA